jgi:hypothetical protein
MIFRRLELKEDAKWYDPEVLANALVTYNYKMANSATHMTPADAGKPENSAEVRVRLEAHSVKKRNDPDLAVGISSGSTPKEELQRRSTCRSGARTATRSRRSRRATGKSSITWMVRRNR